MKEPLGFFPRLLSPVFEVVSAACPLESAQREALAASGFVMPERLARAVAKRQEEFRAGRYCAWQALARAGAAPGEVGIQEDHAPQWPAGFVGSIAHGHGRAVAAVARADRAVSVGIDLEPVMAAAQAQRLRASILTAGDDSVVSRQQGWSEGERVTFVFSVKEAIYKCLRPLCGHYFGFHDAELDSIDEPRGGLVFHLNKEIGPGFGAGWSGSGRFARGEGWIFAGIELLKG